jgi:hypothetical protein
VICTLRRARAYVCHSEDGGGVGGVCVRDNDDGGGGGVKK